MYQAHLRSELRLSDDEEILSKCLSLLGVLAKYYQQAFLNDQLIKGRPHLMNDKKIYTWVVLAIQLFVDTRRVVGKELDRCIWRSSPPAEVDFNDVQTVLRLRSHCKYNRLPLFTPAPTICQIRKC